MDITKLWGKSLKTESGFVNTGYRHNAKPQAQTNSQAQAEYQAPTGQTQTEKILLKDPARWVKEARYGYDRVLLAEDTETHYIVEGPKGKAIEVPKTEAWTYKECLQDRSKFEQQKAYEAKEKPHALENSRFVISGSIGNMKITERP